jgi:CRP-like cAMP-binding protein
VEPLELSYQIGEQFNGSGFRFPLLLTDEVMKSMTCTARETVSRIVGPLRKEGWTSIESQVVTVLELHGLKSLI